MSTNLDSTLLQHQQQHHHHHHQQPIDPPYPGAAENMAQHVLGTQVLPNSHSRSSSIASRYTPDVYQNRGSTEMPRSEDFLTPYNRAPNTQMVLHQSQAQPPQSSSGGSRRPSSSYTPAVPEQYQPPPETGRSFPPAQIGWSHAPIPSSSSPRMSLEVYDQRQARPRYDSSASHRSQGRSSLHSDGRRSHESQRERRGREGRAGSATSTSRKHDVNVARDPPRGYGSSLFWFFGGIKRAWKG